MIFGSGGYATINGQRVKIVSWSMTPINRRPIMTAARKRLAVKVTKQLQYRKG